jgi:type IV pilus assembly protein PilQ
VTPHVIDKNFLKLKILTNKDELDFSRTVAGNPTIVTKKAETNVMLSNGQTTVIGGLSKETASESEAGVPFLKDIPGLGWLFKSRGKANSMEEVLIFITPYILEEKPVE